MLMALLLGIAFHFLAEEGRCVPGIEFTAKTVLPFGVALLGVRISVELLLDLGAELIMLVVLVVILTIVAVAVGSEAPLDGVTGASGLIVVAVALVHMYLGLVAVKGSLDAIVRGSVSEAWARQHHQAWFEDEASSVVTNIAVDHEIEEVVVEHGAATPPETRRRRAGEG